MAWREQEPCTNDRNIDLLERIFTVRANGRVGISDRQPLSLSELLRQPALGEGEHRIYIDMCT